jgi:phosphoglycerol transferase MdoB-like AlkP superfamily enzyme
LKANDFETVVSVKDYPSHEIKTTLGVPDDYMFKFSMPILNKLAKKNQPFLSVFMTASDHGPYYIPPYFHPKTKDIKTKIVEYSDYSLKEFFKAAQKQIWYKNTLFVLIADHGAPLRNSYEIPLDYVHSPLVFFHPKGIVSPKIYQKMASQIDVFPTIMGILKLDFLNNTLGIDLLNDSRTYSIINGDDKFGVIDKDWLLIINQDKRIGLYNHKKKEFKNYAMKYEHIANKMKKYGTANLQTYQYLLKSNKVKVK